MIRIECSQDMSSGAESGTKAVFEFSDEATCALLIEAFRLGLIALGYADESIDRVFAEYAENDARPN